MTAAFGFLQHREYLCAYVPDAGAENVSVDMKLSELGEFGLIGEISRSFSAPEGVRGIGDDCAVIPQRGGVDTLVSSDMLVEGSHFLLEDIGPYRLGWKSAAVNLSDIAAMGGRPMASFLAFALPEDFSVELAREFMRGYRDISLEFNCPLLGGDTTSAPDRMSICVTVLGECPHGAARLRSYAREGDLVCVSGPLGDSAAGLRIILDGIGRDAAAEALVERHYLPTPRVDEGLALSATPGVHAMMDISDGVGSDLRHILEASGVGAEIDMAALPFSAELKTVCAGQGWDPAELALCGGEDYELLFTLTPEAERSLCLPHFVIGRITSGSGIVWKGSQRDYLGFRHF